MTDKEVGELWSQAMHVLKLPNNGYALIEWIEASQNLIHKLVEERTKLILIHVYYHPSHIGPRPTALDCALRDFGIDPKEFEK